MGLLPPRRSTKSGSTDELLVRKASAGDKEAFADLYERHLEAVFRYFFYRLGHREDAEDLAEQLFLKAWQAIGQYDFRGAPFSSWLFRIAHNMMVDHHRARHEVEPLDEEIEIEDQDTGPAELAIQRAEARRLSDALAQLGPVEQSVVALRFLEGLDHRKVAGIIGKSEVATRSIQSRALARLAVILGDGERREP